MKNLISTLALAISVFYSQNASAYSVDVLFEDLTGVDGFKIFIENTPATSTSDFILTAGPAMDIGWWPMLSSNPSLNVQGANMTGASLTHNKLFTLESTYTFGLTSPLFTYGDTTDLQDTQPYKMTFDAASNTYTVAAVPIPGAVWLLGSGLAGMVAMRRKKN